jgi:hypothetical protein
MASRKRWPRPTQPLPTIEGGELTLDSIGFHVSVIAAYRTTHLGCGDVLTI